MHPTLPLTQDLVLVGGGHAHALVLRRWGMNPLPGARLTLVNPDPTAPYTGMLPGYLAGHYNRSALDIDLVRLARFAGARLILGRATGIDAGARLVTVETAGGPLDLAYDAASINVGITARLPDVPGMARNAIPAKPLGRLARRWTHFVEAVGQGKMAPDVAVVGGGIAGCELAMAIAHRLRDVPGGPRVTLLERGPTLTGTGLRNRRALRRTLSALGVRTVTNATIASATDHGLRMADGSDIPARLVISAAGAQPFQWLADSGLPVKDGFLLTDDKLRVEGVQDLFAVGDCALIMGHPRPRAGVFAVRAAPVLQTNLRRTLAGGALRRFRPQTGYLKLVALGGKRALADRAGISLEGRAIWTLKDWIDRRFMRRLSDLPAMPQPRPPTPSARGVRATMSGQPLCGGCGAKIGGATLADALAALPASSSNDLLAGPGDDAALLRWGVEPGGHRQVFSTDHLRAFTLDPILQTEISALHALGDIWAMGATPQAALASITLPRMADPLLARSLAEMTAAAARVLGTAGAALAGGHSTQGAEMTVGFALTGLVETPITQAGARPGDALILTRPLGSGILLAAEMAGKAKGEHVAALWQTLRTPQAEAARILAGAHAMTDVTGFGLAGHLWAMCRASGVAAELDLDAVPVFDGARLMLRAGVTASLTSTNNRDAPVAGAQGPTAALLWDPQTAGGMLAAVPGPEAGALVRRLRDAGFPACEIGAIHPGLAAVSCRQA